ncbi:MAG: hypothetical protein ABIU05_23475 [Nitrospirales bacterium]
MSSSRFYLGRVIKLGNLTSEGVIGAIRESVSVQIRGIRYTFTDFQEFREKTQVKGVYARLAKYRAEGTVEAVRPDVHSMGQEAIANLIEASSPLVYLPEFSGIAYKHVWNLQREQFVRAFCELVEAREHNFFVRCDIESVTDLRTFVTRLAGLEKITLLQASVKPSNPLFGPCWEPLKDYIKKRRLEEVTIKEESIAGISTKVAEIATKMSDGTTGAAELRELMEPLLNGVGDAALLMAADGYGHGKVVGTEENRTVTIKTSENQKSFVFDSDPSPEELFQEAYKQFGKINDERYLDH